MATHQLATNIEAQKIIVEKQLGSLAEKITTVKEALESKKEELGEDGLYTAAYKKIKESFNIVAQAYHSNTLIGKHVKLLLKHRLAIFRKLRKIVPDGDTIALSKLDKLLAPYLRRWTMLHELFQLTKAARMIEPHEIAYLEMLFPKYAEDSRAAIKVEWRREARRTKKSKKGQVHTPLKLHMMEVHVPQFARRW